ncbi:MAG: excinuclease ABC subunit UvrA [Saprospiraceae bacterium]|jgi:excinuclease ABC subunit A|nr:excinuclease ABC subunit UvrA [Saprospiraceae bacterium]MBK6478636.1 excinuclease ABC subunit UvrA [Saprospiraceae bacterium]MBK6814130.1 excinuclease ABC subunit UvrA [Saprospiraceae bacterium]MBK7373568.1 excinuclease ABC subunit UvrA [Saprospiraceae bacterium]MBK7607437.1 excinuclease ABC subunit UvrA [Saprospiraceae bacterium]
MAKDKAQDQEEQEYIEVVGASEHNLKHVSLKIPRNQLVVITGLSGSGKSSLAFDTIYAEGQRRYMETFSAYARQFIGTMERPDVELITGLSPVISIEQKTSGWNPRSTVGTITEIYDLFRLLFARAGEAYSYATGKKMVKYSEAQVIDHILTTYNEQKIVLLAPVIRGRKGHYREIFEQARKQGYSKVRVDGKTMDLKPGMQVDRYKVHDIEVVIDRIQVMINKRDRLASSVQLSMKMGNGLLMVEDEHGNVVPYSQNLMDAEHGISYEDPSPNTFSFNSPYGACPSCDGLGKMHQVDIDKVIPDANKSINEAGILPLGEVRENMTFQQLRAISKKYGFTFSTPVNKIPAKALELILHGGDDSFDVKTTYSQNDFVYNLANEGLLNMLIRWHRDSTSEKIRQWAEEFMTISECPECKGARLKIEALHFKIGDQNISQLADLDLSDLAKWLEEVQPKLSSRQQQIGTDVIKEIGLRLKFLLHVGLDYLSMNRPANSLSGGESQRTRLATQIGSQLTGVTYILDEPSIGLHARDNQRLIQALRELRDIGNSLLVVEHDKEIMLASDYLIDLGPGAGTHGGEIVAQGTPRDFMDKQSMTADFLSGKQKIEVPKSRRPGNGKYIHIEGASGHNLQSVNVSIPLGTFICVTGVSGSGKSSLINETLYPILRKYFYGSLQKPLAYKKLTGIDEVDKVIEIDQSPIGRTPRSNPATYTGVFTDIRNIFTGLPESMIRGYKAGRFSFNVKGGRCETCEGGGMRVIEMNFLPDVLVECETCLGRRYNRETLEILYKGKNISQVLDMKVEDAMHFFENIPNIHRRMKTLYEVGLGYISLGQQATTLSGGEAQRVKLSEELSKRDSGNTLYILDEPTTGLHFQDIQHLIDILNRLVDRGNTVLVIEHNLDVIKVADHIIDMGPEGGKYGGRLVAEGPPEKVAKSKTSLTAKYLKDELGLK